MKCGKIRGELVEYSCFTWRISFVIVRLMPIKHFPTFVLIELSCSIIKALIASCRPTVVVFSLPVKKRERAMIRKILFSAEKMNSDSY